MKEEGKKVYIVTIDRARKFRRNIGVAPDDFTCDWCGEIVPRGTLYKKAHEMYGHLEGSQLKEGLVPDEHLYECVIVRMRNGGADANT